MATNFYFNNFGASQEQTLIEDLIIESIKIYGIDVYYLPKTSVNIDNVLNEPEYSTFGSQYFVEMYIKNVNGFDGDGEFLSKFGIQVRDQITFTMSQRSFANEIGDIITKTRPQEGDLIWFPLTQTLYQIKFVDVKAIFYQLGALQTYDITCELYESNSEVFNTGIPDIDNKYNAISLDVSKNTLMTQSNNVIVTEDSLQILLEDYRIEDIDLLAQNETFEKEGLNFIDFTEFDPFSEGNRA